MLFAFSLHVVPSAHQILAVSTLANMVIEELILLLFQPMVLHMATYSSFSNAHLTEL